MRLGLGAVAPANGYHLRPMSFFAVLLALLIEQVKPLPRGNRVGHAMRAWVSWVARTLTDPAPKPLMRVKNGRSHSITRASETVRGPVGLPARPGLP